MNIKTGGCSEDCSYCSQSSRYDTSTEAGKLLALDPVIQEAKRAKEAGSTRFCMGAAWRDVVAVNVVLIESYLWLKKLSMLFFKL